jgi:signal transduction histidine kinase
MSQAAEWEGSAKPAEEALQRLASSMDLGVLLVSGRCVAWASERLLELGAFGSLAEVAGLALEDLFIDAGQGLPDAERLRSIDCALRQSDGEQRPVLCRPAWPEIGPETDAWVVEDLTHRRRLEREILEAHRELYQLHREVASLHDRVEAERADREELLAVVSHELRTPVTVIAGYHRLLLAEEVGYLGEEQRRFLEESARSCRKLDAFVTRVLEASRQPRGGQVLEVCSAPLRPLVEEVARSLHPLLEDCGARVEVQQVPERCRARFDRQAVERILTNLIGNAIRHSPRGGTIEVAGRAAFDDGREMVEVTVCDQGPGIPTEDRERIFEAYVQADDTGRSGRLGLGLAICRRLVEAHGGRIAAGEGPEGGARFSFTLPVAEK